MEKMLTVRLAASDYELLDREAKETERSKGAVIRLLVRKALANKDQEPGKQRGAKNNG